MTRDCLPPTSCDILAVPALPCYSVIGSRPIVAGTGYVELLSRRQLRDGRTDRPVVPASIAARQHLAVVSSHHAGGGRLLQGCDPCGDASHRVSGDFNGDCSLLSSDASALQAFLGVREEFERTGVGADPLESYTSSTGQQCAWLSQQANPTHDLMTGTKGRLG